MAHTFRLVFKAAHHRPHRDGRWSFALMLTALVSGLGLVAYQKRSPRPYQDNLPTSFHSVFGSDQREEINLESSPLQAIGRIELQPEGVIPWLSNVGVPICTATLVSVDLILTNAHCLMDRATGLLTKKVIWFRPAFGKDSPPIAAKALKLWLGSLEPKRDRANDWALVKIDQAYGETYPWLELAPLWEDQPFPPHATSLVAYATDFKDGGVAVIHRTCVIRNFDSSGAYFRHDCDMNAGSSGGPLIVWGRTRPQILAINAAHIDPKAVSYLPTFSAGFANIAIGTTRFMDVLEAVRQDLPLPSYIRVHSIDLSAPPASTETFGNSLGPTRTR